MRGLNLSSFKKMKEDAHSATMIHKDGHTLMIAKASLPALQRKQLEQLPMHMMAKGGEVQHYDEGTGNAQPMPSAPPIEIEPIPQQSGSTPPATVPASSMVAPQAPIVPLGAQNAVQAQVPGFQEEKAANLAGAQALQTQGNQETQALQDTSDQIENLPTQSDIVNANKTKSDELFNAYKAKELNPDHYWENHSKIAAGIGLLLSSAGEAAGGRGGSGALDVINRGIDRDIDAQKNNQQQKMNLWKMNREALGSDLAADLATKNQLYTGLKYKIDEAAAQAKGPLALANAQAANAKIDQAIGMNNFKISLMNPTSDNPDPASRVQFLVPEGARTVVNKEISEAQNMVRNFEGIKEAFWQAAKDARPLTGGPNTSLRAFVPGMHTAGQSAFAARIAPTIQEQEGTVRQQAFDNVDQRMTPKLGDSDQEVEAKWKTFLDYAKSKASAPNAKTYGIDLKNFPSTNTLGLGGSQHNGTPNKPETVIQGGHTYKLNPTTGKYE